MVITYLFPMHPFSTHSKHQKTVRFQRIEKGCIGNIWVKRSKILVITGGFDLQISYKQGHKWLSGLGVFGFCRVLKTSTPFPHLLFVKTPYYKFPRYENSFINLV